MIVGLGEDGPDGLSPASRVAIDGAEVVMGAARHLALLPGLGARGVAWPVPFADGIAPLVALRGRRVVVLVSGDPFWFGAGTVLARHLEAGEWRALPGVSCFALACARLGWGIEGVACLGLHAAPLARMRAQLAPGARLVMTLRDGAAVADVAGYLDALGFGDSRLWVMEALGGPRERVRACSVAGVPGDVAHPVVVAVEVAGAGAVVTRASGRDDGLFQHDGQITKRPVRALALSALAPRGGEVLWDIGCGSGSVSIEWLLADARNRAVGFEADAARAARARGNAEGLGVVLDVIEAHAPEGLAGAPKPDAVFIGGGLSEALLQAVVAEAPKGTRLVAHAVTLESEALLAQWHGARGGSLLRIELAEAGALGTRRGWKSAYPVVQWSVVL